MALSSFRSDIELHTFYPLDDARDIDANFGPLGIRTVPHATSSRLEFAYLFPLSTPRIRPVPSFCTEPVNVEARVALRFGCLEGHFRVSAESAVYDPQSGDRGETFGQNGSTARRLALSLNSSEARSLARTDDLTDAAARLLAAEQAEVVVIKDGPAGAYVFERGYHCVHIPAYEAGTLFKIGSGDIFTAVFAHNWLEGTPASAAADLASRYTAQYVENRVVPLPNTLTSRQPRHVGANPRVALIADIQSISGQWLLEEVRDALDGLGAEVIAVRDVGSEWDVSCEKHGHPDVLLFLGFRGLSFAGIAQREVGVLKKVAFIEDSTLHVLADEGGFCVTSDLCRAIYETRWV